MDTETDGLETYSFQIWPFSESSQTLDLWSNYLPTFTRKHQLNVG